MLNKQPITVAIVTVLCCVAVQVHGAKPAKGGGGNHIQRGIELAQQKHYDAAAEEFGKAIEQNPKDPRGYANRGTAYRQGARTAMAAGDSEGASTRYQSALADFAKYIELAPKDASAYVEHGQTLSELKQFDAFCKIPQRGLIPSGGPLGISRCDGGSCSLAIGGPAICVSARIFRILLDRFAEFLSSGIKVLFLGKLDPALNIISAAVLLGRFRSVDLNSRTTKNRYDGDSEWLLVQHMYFSFCLLFARFTAYRRENLCKGPSQSLGARIGDAVVSAVSAAQRLARSTRIRCAEDSARYIR